MKEYKEVKGILGEDDTDNLQILLLMKETQRSY